MLKKIVNTYIVPPLAYLLILFISLTLRREVIGKEHEKKAKELGKPVILAFWHGRLFYFPFYFWKSNRTWKILSSPSIDGEIIARTLSLFGYGVVRGSTFKNARKALRELKRHTDEGYNTVLIADGSRGPALKLQPGALMVSKLTGAPALPVTVSFDRYWNLKTWDRLMIPKPFSKVIVAFGEHVTVPEKCDSATLEAKRVELEKTLLKITETADTKLQPAGGAVR